MGRSEMVGLQEAMRLDYALCKAAVDALLSNAARFNDTLDSDNHSLLVLTYRDLREARKAITRPLNDLRQRSHKPEHLAFTERPLEYCKAMEALYAERINALGRDEGEQVRRIFKRLVAEHVGEAQVAEWFRTASAEVEQQRRDMKARRDVAGMIIAVGQSAPSRREAA